MTDIARLGLQVDSRPVDRATQSLDRFGRQAARTEGSAQRVEKSAVGMGAAMRTAAVGIAAATAAVASISGAVRAAESYTNISNSLQGMGQSADEAAANIERIAGVANRTRSPLEATAKLYQRMSVASKELGASQDQVFRFAENVGLALAASGGTAEEASGALMQLSQAMAGGTVRAEEFNSILEGAYPIALAAAKGIDGAAGSVGKLRQMVVDGEVSSREFFDAVLSQTSELEAAFARTTPTIGQALTVLGNSFTMFIGQMNGATGASNMVAQAIMGVANGLGFLADHMDRAIAYIGAAAIALGIRYAGAAALAIARTVTLAGVLRALRGAIISTGIGALVVLAGEMIYQFGELVRATGSWGAALSLLGDVAAGVWEGIRTSAGAIVPALGAVWASVEAAFFGALSRMSESWSRFLGKMAADAKGVPVLEDMLATASGNAFGASAEFDAKASTAQGTAKALTTEAANIATQGFEKAKAAVAALQEAAASAGSEARDVTAAIEEVNAALGGTGTGTDGGTSGKGGTGGKGGLSDAAKEAEATAKKLADTLKDLRGEYATLAATIGMTAEEEMAYRAVQEAGVTMASKEGQEISKLTLAIDQLKKARDSARQAADEIKGTFTDAFKGIVTGAQSMGEAVSGVLGKLADMLLTSAGNSLFGGIANSMGSFFSTSVPGFATGVGSAPGGLAVVGEQGPELMNVPKGSRVIPNHKLGAMLGGGGRSQMDVRVYVDQDGNWQAKVENIAEAKSVSATSRGLSEYDRVQAPRTFSKVQQDPRKRF